MSKEHLEELRYDVANLVLSRMSKGSQYQYALDKMIDLLKDKTEDQLKEIKDKKPLNSSASNEDLTVIAGADVRRAEPVGQGHCTANGNPGSRRQILHYSVMDGPCRIIKKAIYPVRTGRPEGARKVRR